MLAKRLKEYVLKLCNVILFQLIARCYRGTNYYAMLFLEFQLVVLYWVYFFESPLLEVLTNQTSKALICQHP